MQAGIAMGEMVPGTIMIVTQFIGFIAAYRHPGFIERGAEAARGPVRYLTVLHGQRRRSK